MWHQTLNLVEHDYSMDGVIRMCAPFSCTCTPQNERKNVHAWYFVSYAKSLKQTSHHVEITPLSYKSTPRKESSLSGTSSHSPPRRPMMDLAQPNLPCRDPNKHAHLQVLFLKKMQQWQRDRAKPVANRRIWKPSGGRSSKWKNMPARCHLILAYLPFLFFFPWVMARWIGKETRSGRGLFHKHTKDLSALSLPL